MYIIYNVTKKKSNKYCSSKNHTFHKNNVFSVVNNKKYFLRISEGSCDIGLMAAEYLALPSQEKNQLCSIVP